MPTDIQHLPTPFNRADSGGGIRITGRMVFWITTAFFAVVVGVNVMMAYLAVNTFGGLQVQAPYKLGLKYNEEIAAAQAQEKLGWRVDSSFASAASGAREIVISVRDREGRPLAGLTARARLASPTHPADVDIAFPAATDGTFRSTFNAPAGQWALDIALFDGAALKYRSANRIMLR